MVHHRRSSAVAVAALLIVGVAACQEPLPAPSVAVLRDQAAGAERAGRYGQAADHYLQLVKAEPERPEWVAGAGRCLGRSGRFNDAIDLLESKRAEFPGYHDLPALLARTLLLKVESESGTLDPASYLRQAADTATGILTENPGHLEAALILAQARYLLGDFDAAAAAAEAAAARHPDHPGSHILVGRIHADRWRALQERARAGALDADLQARAEAARSSAEAAYRRAVAIDPARAFPHLALGDLLADGGDLQAALRHYGDALVADPDTAVDHGRLDGLEPAAREAFYQGVLDRYLEKPLLDARKLATLRFFLGRAFYDQLRFDDALGIFAAVLEANPGYVNAAYYAAMAAYRLDDHDAAERHAATFATASAANFADIIRRLPEPQRQELGAVIRYLADRAFQRARIGNSRELNHVIACLLDTADAWNNWALLCRETERYQDSLTGYRRALEKEPDSPQLLNDTAVILHYHMGSPEDLATARAMYQRAIAEADRVTADAAADPVQKERAAKARSDARLNLEALDK